MALRDDLHAHAARFRAAKRPADVFGPLNGPDLAARLQRLGEIYRALALEMHPDRYVHSAELGDLATELFVQLSGWRDEAERQLRRVAAGGGHFFEVRGTRFAVLTTLPGGDVCDVFTVCNPEEPASEPLVLKVATDPANNDLLDNEVQALHRLWSAPQLEIDVFGRYLPRLLAGATLPDGRRANLLSLADGYVTLAQVQAAYPKGVDGRTISWMGNRVLELLAWVHRCGVVHGAVTPDHVLVHPVTHGCTLVDWCYAVCDWRYPDGPHLAAVPKSSRQRYPDEVFQRAAASPRLDLFLAAGTLGQTAGIDLWNFKRPLAMANPLDPPIAESMAEVLRGCRLPRLPDRFADAFEVYERWRQAQLRAFGPRKYHPFSLPVAGA